MAFQNITVTLPRAMAAKPRPWALNPAFMSPIARRVWQKMVYIFPIWPDNFSDFSTAADVGTVRYYNAVGNKNITLQKLGAVQNWGARYGRSQLGHFIEVNSRWSTIDGFRLVNGGKYLDVTKPFTVIQLFSSLPTTVIGGGHIWSSGNSNNHINFGTDTSGYLQSQIRVGNGAGQRTTATKTVLGSVTDAVCAACAFDPINNTVAFYLNGETELATTSAGTVSWGGQLNDHYITEHNTGAGKYSIGKEIYFLAVIQEALSAEVLKQITADPYCLIRPDFDAGVVWPTIVGASSTSNLFLSPVSQSGSGIHPFIANGAQSLSITTQQASTLEIFIAAATNLLSAITQVGAGNSAGISGTSLQTLLNVSQAGIGNLTLLGIAGQTLATVSQSATGLLAVVATAVQTLSNTGQSGSGTSLIGSGGLAVQSTPVLTQSSSGLMIPSGTTIQVMPSLAQLANILEVLSTIGAQDLPSLVQSAITNVVFSATGILVFPSVEQAANALELFEATATQLLSIITQAGAGFQPLAGVSGTGIQTFPAIGQIASILVISFILNFMELLAANSDIDLLQAVEIDLGTSSSVDI